MHFAVTLFSLFLQFKKKKDLSDTEDITFAMRNRQEWFNEKMAAVSPEIVSEVQLSADIIAVISTALGEPLIKVTESMTISLSYFFASNALLTIGGGYNHLVISNISKSCRGLRKECRGFLRVS